MKMFKNRYARSFIIGIPLGIIQFFLWARFYQYDEPNNWLSIVANSFILWGPAIINIFIGKTWKEKLVNSVMMSLVALFTAYFVVIIEMFIETERNPHLWIEPPV